MKKLLVLSLITSLFLISCSGTNHQLVGTWKVSKVETNFKATNIPKAVITHIKNEQKQISFKIINDSIMVLILDKNTHEARWKMDPNSKMIKYHFKSQKNYINKLGKWEGNEIVSTTNTPLGTLTVVFTKQ